MNAETDGSFSFSAPRSEGKYLTARYVGYVSDSMRISDRADAFYTFVLEADDRLGVVEVRGVREGVSISTYAPIKTEVITAVELKKAACCDLAGCFETQTTVQPQVTNVLTNATELRILGLSGVYNQVLIDGLPMIQGLTYTYGISSVPGTSVQNISVSKGTNSVLQGFESISGQINVETKSADLNEPLFLNVYANNFGERHFNANIAYGGGRQKNITSLHMVRPADRVDRDGDGFTDLPQLTRYLISHKWEYGRSTDWGWSSTAGVRFLHETREAGQMRFDPDLHSAGTEVYGQQVRLAQPEVWTKTAYRFNDRTRIALLASSFLQRQRSSFGTVRYDAEQVNVYVNIQAEQSYGKSGEVKTGMSLRSLDLREDIRFSENSLGRTFDGHYRRSEVIPGVFAENTLRFWDGKLTWLAGIRGDVHNSFGTTITPRTLLKYDVSEDAAIRASAGTGWRTVNFFSENIGLLAGSRNVIFEESLRPERAANYGINYTHNYAIGPVSGFISADFYRTRFSNQVFPDFDADPTEARVSNFGGKAVADGAQAEILVRFFKRLEFKAGYNFLDVYREIEGVREEMPFNPRHKWLATVSYRTENDRFRFDANFHRYGRQRLPSTAANPPQFRRPETSERFTVVNAQITYAAGAFEIYGGCENIFDFRQLRPILGWEDPFGPHFDTAFVWGPVRGREIYGGVRYLLSRK